MSRSPYHSLLLLVPTLAACWINHEADAGAIDADMLGVGGSDSASSGSGGPDDAFDGSDDGSDSGSTTDDTSVGTQGEQQFLLLCASCHGMRGEGTELGYELQHPVRGHSTWVVRNGRSGDELDGSSMMAWDTRLVSDATLDEIWDYLDSFPQPTTGKGLYLDHCGNCHGTDASGGMAEKNISNEGYQSILEAVREGKHTDDLGSRQRYMPAFDATWLTDAEVQLIADHIASL